jgi:hypothetical protein
VCGVWQRAIADPGAFPVPFPPDGERQRRRFAWKEEMPMSNDVRERDLHRSSTSEICSSLGLARLLPSLTAELLKRSL